MVSSPPSEGICRQNNSNIGIFGIGRLMVLKQNSHEHRSRGRAMTRTCTAIMTRGLLCYRGSWHVSCRVSVILPSQIPTSTFKPTVGCMRYALDRFSNRKYSTATRTPRMKKCFPESSRRDGSLTVVCFRFQCMMRRALKIGQRGDASVVGNLPLIVFDGQSTVRLLDLS